MELKEKKKLLVFHPIIAPYRIDLFNILSQNYDMKFCMFHRNMIDQKFDYSKISSQFLFTPIILDEFYKLPLLKIRKHIISTIKEFNPDIVLVPECGYVSIIVTLYKKLFNKHYKVISIIDDSYDMLTNNNQFSIKHEWAEKILIPLFDNIINVEPRVVSFFQKKYKKGIFFPIIQDEQKIRSIYNRVLPISEKYIDQYQLKDKKVILFVGRLVKLKNVHTLIEVFTEINLPNTNLVIVGTGEEEENLKRLAANNSNIIFTGRLEGEELYAWYNIAEIFVLPSIQEAFGAVTNEALIGGCFSLVSQKAGSNCLIEEGVNGYTFDPYSKKEIASKLQNSISKISLRKYPIKLREDRMLCSFQEAILKLIQSINNPQTS